MAASLDLSPRQFKLGIIMRISGCSRCSPHKGCNRSYKKYRQKKAFKIRNIKQKRQSYIIKEFI